MNPELLEQACLAAGLEPVKPGHPGPQDGWIVEWGSGDWCGLHVDNPALAAYVAVRLVERVWELYGLDYSVETYSAGTYSAETMSRCARRRPMIKESFCLAHFTNEPTSAQHGLTVSQSGKRDQWIEMTIRAALATITRRQKRKVDGVKKLT